MEIIIPIENICIFVALLISAILSFTCPDNITPTVELNAWAMKRGELATYHMIPPSAIPPIAQVGAPCPALGPGVGPMPNYLPPVGPPPPPYNNFTAYNGYRPPYNQVHRYIHQRVFVWMLCMSCFLTCTYMLLISHLNNFIS